MITRKGTTATISTSSDDYTNALLTAFSPDDLKAISKAYNERKKRIKKEWKERKIKQASQLNAK